MPDGFTSVFGGENVSPAQLDYVEYTISTSIILVWPFAENELNFVAAHKVDIDALAPDLIVFLPEANVVTKGQDILVRNVGLNPFTVADAAGNTLVVPASGQQWMLWIVDNADAAGDWATVQFGVGVSNANAGALAGAGLRANVTKLDQNLITRSFSGNHQVNAGDRAFVLENTGGVVTYTFDTIGTLPNGWFTYVINAGTGGLTLQATACLIDGSASKVLAPTESAIVFSDGANLRTLGYGRSIVNTVTGLTIPIGPGGTTTLTPTQVAAQVQDYTGTLTSNADVEYGGVIGYWFVDNQTTGAFTTTMRTNAIDPGVVVPQGNFSILRSNGTNMEVAFTSSTGTVTSVGTTPGELVGGPITASGTIGLANTSVGAGTYGDATHFAVVTVDQKGRLTAADEIALGTAALKDVGTGAGQVPLLDVNGLIPSANGGCMTGMIADFMLSTPPPGWIFATGTIGKGGSGATNRANDDTFNLFSGIWGSYPNTTAPVLPGGRGASAIADFNAGKTIAVADYRGRARVGKDNMGGTAAGRVTATTATPDGNTMGATGGAQTQQAAVDGLGVTTTFPNDGTVHTTGSVGVRAAIYTEGQSVGGGSGAVTSGAGDQVWGVTGAITAGEGTGGQPPFSAKADFNVIGSAHGTINAGAKSGAFPTMPPFSICNVIVKL